MLFLHFRSLYGGGGGILNMIFVFRTKNRSGNDSWMTEMRQIFFFRLNDHLSGT